MAGALPELDFQGAFDPIANQNALAQYQAQQKILPGEIAATEATNAAKSALAPLTVQAEQQKSALATADYNRSTVSQIAQDTLKLDPDERPNYFNEQMKEQSEKGNKYASQFADRYRDDVVQHLASDQGDAVGAGKSSAAAVQNPDMEEALDLQIAKLPPGQATKTYANYNRAIESFNKVRTADDLQSEVKLLEQAGIPVSQMLPGLDFSNTDPKAFQFNFAALHNLAEKAVPYRDAFARAAMREAAGLPVAAPPNKVMMVGNRLYSVDPLGQSAKQIASADKFEYEGPDKTMGAAKIFNPVTGTLTAPGASGSAPSGSFLDFADKMDGLENGTGNPGARNPNSSAMGNGQFIKATWLEQAKSALPAQTAGKSDDEILAMRSDPQAARMVTAAYAQQNATKLLDEGMPVTTGTLALAHRLGPDGAMKVLEASSDTPLSSLLPRNVIAANPDMRGKTAGEYANGILQKIGNQPILTPTGDNASTPGDSRLSGDAYLRSVPDQSIANQVKAIAEGRQQQPSSFFLKTPYGQMMMRMLAQYDPGFDLTLYQSRVATQNDLAKGKMGQNVSSFNTAIGHAARLDASIDALGNSSYFPGVINPVMQAAKGQMSPEFQSALKTFTTDKAALVDELTRAFRGTGGNVHDIENWENNLKQADSPVALHSAVREAMALLKSRIEAVGDQYSRGMRKTVAPETLLTPAARAGLARLTGGDQSNGGQQKFVENQVYSDKHGNKAKYQNGAWVPVQ